MIDWGISIVRTLVYHDLFNFPLREQEIFKFLVQIPNSKHQILNNFKYPKSKIQNTLERLIRERRIFKKGNFYYFQGREKIIKIREKREKYSQEKIKIAKRAVQYLKIIPWLKMIGITGALAMSNASEKEDIDLLLVTRANRLWLTRLLAIFILEILGIRRRPKAKQVKNKICLNMFLDEKALLLANNKQNLFIAHEICQLKPIFDRDNTYERFLKENEWVEQYLPNSNKAQKSKLKTQSYNLKLKTKKSLHYSLLITHLLNCLENLAFKTQLKYMKSKKTSEEVSPNFAFFHPRDRTKEILKKYQQKVDFLGFLKGIKSSHKKIKSKVKQRCN